MPPPTLIERIAHLALDSFDSLPPKCKPTNSAENVHVWTPLSAVVLSRQPDAVCTGKDKLGKSHDAAALKIVSIGTGTKSLPVSALSKCNGLILHDCHAEILALRGFNYWLLCEMEWILTRSNYRSEWLELGNQGARYGANDTENIQQKPFRLRSGVEISLFATEAPCGDASMDLLISAAKSAGADISPWPTHIIDSTVPRPMTEAAQTIPLLPPGRGGFSNLGVLRRKPARADAEISMSMSCTDKLMLKQFTSLLAFPVDGLVECGEEAFLRRLIVYSDHYDLVGYSRAFSAEGRLREVTRMQVESGAKPRFFDTEVLPVEFRRFKFEKGQRQASSSTKNKVTNISSIWITGAGDTGGSDVIEVVVNGVKQGYKQFAEKKRKGSVLCRYSLLHKASSVGSELSKRDIQVDATAVFPDGSYSDMKKISARQNRKALKSATLEALGGWPQTVVDDFHIDVHLLHLSYPYNFPSSRSRMMNSTV